LDPSIKKYWKQRHRLFHRFDQGIQLDEEGWFSVTPEQIAHHVASRMVDLFRHNNSNHSTTTGEQLTMTVLDAFGGCGGNALALAQHPAVAQVICVDIDRSKLQRAAQNAAIYQIPPHKIVFVECNVIFILEYCYSNGIFRLDQPIDSPEVALAMMAAMPPPVATEMVQGYQIGGIDTLPHRIDAVFLDPPWGGVDYEVFGKQGYCLERNMLIPRPAYQQQQQQHAHEGVGDAFFDTFVATPHHAPRNKKERKAAFNCGLDATNCVNGAELLALAAQAAPIAVYDIPRNTSRQSLGQAALQAGYRGNGKLEEHYLNGRLKTVTAYFGRDWRDELLL
jgi:trimethylguanosine synthase